MRKTSAEDAADLEVFEKRRREPVLDFDEVVKMLKRKKEKEEPLRGERKR